ELVVEVGGRERAEAEEDGVPDGNLPGEADEDVEAERGDAEIADLDQDAEAVLVEIERRRGDQRDARHAERRRRARRENRGVRRVARVEVAARPIVGNARHQTRSMSLVPNRPYGQIMRIAIST